MHLDATRANSWQWLLVVKTNYNYTSCFGQVGQNDELWLKERGRPGCLMLRCQGLMLTNARIARS